MLTWVIRCWVNHTLPELSTLDPLTSKYVYWLYATNSQYIMYVVERNVLDINVLRHSIV